MQRARGPSGAFVRLTCRGDFGHRPVKRLHLAGSDGLGPDDLNDHAERIAAWLGVPCILGQYQLDDQAKRQLPGDQGMPQVIDSFRSSTWGWLRGTALGWLTLLLCLIGIGFLIILWKWIANLATTYEITDDRLILRKGIFVKSIDEIELYRVKDIRIDFTLINQWAGIGTISITSSDETTRHGPLVIRDVENAQARRESLRTLVDTARQKRRVREIDVGHED